MVVQVGVLECGCGARCRGKIFLQREMDYY